MPRHDMELTPEMRAKYVLKSNPENLEQAVAEEIHQAVRELLSRLGTSGFCDTCQRAIYWVHTTNGRRRVPYSTRGVPHTTDCDMAGRPGVKLGRWPVIVR